MTGVMAQCHLTNGESILEKVLEFTAFAAPTEASDLRSSKDPSLRPELPLGTSQATRCLERIVRTTKHAQRRP